MVYERTHVVRARQIAVCPSLNGVENLYPQVFPRFPEFLILKICIPFIHPTFNGKLTIHREKLCERWKAFGAKDTQQVVPNMRNYRRSDRFIFVTTTSLIFFGRIKPLCSQKIKPRPQVSYRQESKRILWILTTTKMMWRHQ